MGGRAIRGYIAEMNWSRMLLMCAIVGVFILSSTQPAFAFSELADNISGKATTVATGVKVILYAAGVISVLAGAAPMLWGEVRVKWIVSALVACAVISMMGALVGAFVNGK